ncbi:HisA/HisF-related TIM barrel protein [Candidatus Methylopumilus planktonicus]|uniref:HisA/HisF-related TIM barrel protein n=1 Tax=Candidatus Methylopumilus planktonicus TaxID=1581557 RepID=UPI003D18BD47
MLKKRLIGVVTVKEGIAVQSFGYRRYLPLGKPECLVENLDRWCADEILIQVIDRSITNIEPDFQLIEKLGKLGLETPLIYAGGVRSVADGVKLIQLGADRIVFDALLRDDLLVIKDLSEQLGAQALIASIPLSVGANKLEWLDYRKHSLTSISEEILDLIREKTISEILITDWKHEGLSGGFDRQIIDNFPLKNIPIIAFGGIDNLNQAKLLLELSNVAAVAVGNYFSYREHAIQAYKEILTCQSVRPPIYKSQFSLIANLND